MKKIIGIALIALVAMAFTLPREKSKKQDEVGIRFKGISLEKAKKSALDNDKLIFIDAHTSWCGPCKRMAATSFKDEAVAELFNEQFINLKIDCEKDVDGPEISRLYKIRAYPTLLVIDSEGKLIKEHVGFMNADQLIAFANSIE